ncbi:putative WD repeat-containing protein 53 [Triplophysa rosa]|uniref:WD repeat-containing protein 53 n=2 Tax=Triplophysa rosa TaxID=992332 RepID=A0A9W7TNC1_TRIRA|nr:putative WD repeat-containing protein 53 [Triplophysa rosa]
MTSQRWSGGHVSSVLCAGVCCGSEQLMATGAEGGEVTLWNHNGSPLSKLHVRGDGDITSVAFSPSSPCVLYASHGQSVSVLDPRNLKTTVTELRDVAEEEINSLSVNETGGVLVVADDSGVVTVIDTQLEKVTRTLRKHVNICSSVTFRPHRPQSLLSAGLDMQVMLWTLPKVRPLWSCSLQDGSVEGAGQMFNPPLAHCVDAASCGDVFACAAEDGCVHLLRVSADSRLRGRSVFKAHSQGVSQARFLNFMSHPYWLATGGNDGLLALWDLSEDAAAPLDNKMTARKKRSKARAKTPKSQMSTQEESESETRTRVEPKLSLNHGDKVNWLCPAVLRGKPSLLVTDQSPELSVYSLDKL